MTETKARMNFGYESNFFVRGARNEHKILGVPEAQRTKEWGEREDRSTAVPAAPSPSC